MRYSFTELNAENAITSLEGGILPDEVGSFLTARGVTSTSFIITLFNEHYTNYANLDYHFLIKTNTLPEARQRFRQMLHYYLDENSPLLIAYAKDPELNFGGKDTNTWTDNNRTTQGRSDYGSTSRTAREDSPLGSDPVGAIDTPAQKSGNEITGGASRTEVKSGSSTEVREKTDNTEILKQYWSGFKNFDGLIHNIILRLTDEHYEVI